MARNIKGLRTKQLNSVDQTRKDFRAALSRMVSGNVRVLEAGYEFTKKNLAAEAGHTPHGLTRKGGANGERIYQDVIEDFEREKSKRQTANTSKKDEVDEITRLKAMIQILIQDKQNLAIEAARLGDKVLERDQIIAEYAEEREELVKKIEELNQRQEEQSARARKAFHVVPRPSPRRRGVPGSRE
jgi:hypothetical protein